MKLGKLFLPLGMILAVIGIIILLFARVDKITGPELDQSVRNLERDLQLFV